MKSTLGRSFPLLILLASAVLARASVSDTLNRAHRVTQEASFTVGSKTYARSSLVTKYCSDNGVQTSDLNPSNDEFNSQMQTTTNKYAGPRAQIEPILKSGGSTSGFDAGAAVNTVIVQIGFPVVISALSILSAWFLFWWSILECCCKKTCCMKEIKEGDPMTCTQKCIGISNVIVGLGLLIILIIWAAQAGSAARGFKYLTCEMASLSSDIVSGVQYKGETPLTFIGLNGLSDMLGSMKSAITTFQTKTGTKPANMDTNRDSLNSKFTAFWSKWNFQGTAYPTLRLDSAVNDTLPDSIKLLDGYVNQALRTEIQTLTNYGNLMSTAYATVDSIKSGSSSMTSAIDSMQTAVNSVRDPVSTLGEQGIKSLGIETFQTVINTALILALIIIITFLGTFYFIAFMNIFKNKLHCLKFLNKLIMIIKILLAIFLNAAAAIFVVVSIVFSNLCYFLWKASSDPSYTANLSNADIQNIMKECVLTTGGGTGDMTKLIGGTSATAQIQTLKDFSSTISSVFNDSYASNFTAATPQPEVGVKTLKTLWQNVYDGKVDDFTTTTGSATYNKLQSDFDTFNNYMSTVTIKNTMTLQGKCASGTTLSATGDAINNLDTPAATASTPYCLQLGKLPNNNGAPTSGAGRYTGLGGASTTTAQANYNKPLTTWNRYQTVVTTAVGSPAQSFSQDYGFGPSTALAGSLSVLEQAYMDNLVYAYNDFKALKNNLAGLVDYVNTFSNNLLSAMNCRIVGIHVKQLQVAMCLKVGDSFINQTTSMGALGFFIFLFPWCICCGIRCAPKKGAADPSQTPHSEPNQVSPPQDAAPVGFQPQANSNPYGAQPYPGPQSFGQPAAKGYL